MLLKFHCGRAWIQFPFTYSAWYLLDFWICGLLFSAGLEISVLFSSNIVIHSLLLLIKGMLDFLVYDFCFLYCILHLLHSPWWIPDNLIWTSSSRLSKLEPTGQTQPPPAFVSKALWGRNHARSLCTAGGCCCATKAELSSCDRNCKQLSKSKLFTIWPFIEKVPWSLMWSITVLLSWV